MKFPELEDDQNIDHIEITLYFSKHEFDTGKYNKTFRETLAQDAYDAILEILDERYPDTFED